MVYTFSFMNFTLVREEVKCFKGAVCHFQEEIQTQVQIQVIIQTERYLSFPSLNKQAVLRGK